MSNENANEILKPFLKTMLERDKQERLFRREQQADENKKYDRLADTVNSIGDKMGELITIIKVQEQKHAQIDKENKRTDLTLQDHGKRVYALEAEMIGIKKDIESNKKPWVKLDKITTIIIAGIFLAASVYYLGFKP